MWSSLPSRADDSWRQQTFVDVARWRARRTPHQLAYRYLVDGERDEETVTYEELDRKACAIAAALSRFQHSQARALLLYPPGLEFVAGFLGCLYAGVIATPAYPPVRSRLKRNDHRLAEIVADADPSVCLTSSKLLPTIERLLSERADMFGGVKMRWIVTDTIDGPADCSWTPPHLHQDDVAFLQYTSGSTSSPRGVAITHANLLHNSRMIYSLFGHSPESVGVIWLPPYHDMGLIGGILQPLFGGFPVTLLSHFAFLQRPFQWLHAISRFRATVSGGPNFAYELCTRRITPEQRASLDLSSWEVAFNGAEPVRRQTLDRFATTFAPCGFRRAAFHPCYGLAEATLLVSAKGTMAEPVLTTADSAGFERGRVRPVAASDPDGKVLVSSGRNADSLQLAIVNGESMTRSAPDEIGEIWVSGPTVGQGYWNRPAETAAGFNAYLADTHEGPFLRTGDLGFIANGELFVTGRMKDLIVIRGLNHYPQDIELTVEHAHAAVRPASSAVFPIDVAEEERLVVMAEVDRHQLGDVGKGIETAVRRAVCDAHGIDVYKLLLVPVGTIPRTTSGKLRRRACRELVSNGWPDPEEMSASSRSTSSVMEHSHVDSQHG